MAQVALARQLATDPGAQRLAISAANAGVKSTAGVALIGVSMFALLAGVIAAVVGTLQHRASGGDWNAGLTASIVLGLLWLALLGGGIALLVVGDQERQRAVESPEGTAAVRGLLGAVAPSVGAAQAAAAAAYVDPFADSE